MDEELGTELVSKNALSLINDNECNCFEGKKCYISKMVTKSNMSQYQGVTISDIQCKDFF